MSATPETASGTGAGTGSPPPGHNNGPAPAWYEDGGRKTALGFWAAGAVLSYGAMQATGWFADVPFVALAAGALVYFAVRGVAVIRQEIDRRG